MKIDKGNQVRITLRHPGRSRLATFLTVFSVIGILTSLALIAVGVVTHLTMSPYAPVLDTYDGSYLSFILGALGLAGTAVHGLLIFLLLDFSKEERAEEFGKACLAILCCATLTLVAGIICCIHIREIATSFQTGILNGMKHYHNNTELKTAVDEVQIRYQCCGLKGYGDWFNYSWINESYVDKAKLEKKTEKDKDNKQYKPDDVPFSCCDPAAFRPCVHEAIHTNSHHYNYDHAKNVTVYKDGCLPRLKKFFGPGLLFIMGILVCSIGIADLLIGAGTRILYTSLLSAVQTGDEFGPGVGILLPGKITEYESKAKLPGDGYA